jgi:hypothetical protein
MTGWIEVHTSDGDRFSVQIKHISDFFPKFDGTSLTVDGTRGILVMESYDDVMRMIEEAQQ